VSVTSWRRSPLHNPAGLTRTLPETEYSRCKRSWSHLTSSLIWVALTLTKSTRFQGGPSRTSSCRHRRNYSWLTPTRSPSL
jgi:hypothetical protein